MNLDRLTDFDAFVAKQVLPATKDLSLLDDKNRKHIQRLVYANLVDRFDAMIDGAILDNCRQPTLIQEAIKRMNQPITEADLVKLLLEGDGLQSSLEEKLKDSLRDSVLRERHSRKLSTLFKVLQPNEECWNTPRVNISTGAISAQLKPQNTTMPYSVCGYADWLYSRRNSVVHGAGTTSFLENDKAQLAKLFKVKVSGRIRIQLSSVTNASTFYRQVVALLYT